MTIFARTDTSIMGRWWWTVDRWSLALLLGLILFGAVLLLAASPAVAVRLGLLPWHFVWRQGPLLPVAVVGMIGISVLPIKRIKLMALVGFAVFMGLVLLTLGSEEIKGAQRWVTVMGVSLQPSEFAKPCFVVVTAMILVAWQAHHRRRRLAISSLLYGLFAGLVMAQPDFGQSVLISAIWLMQLALVGVPLVLILGGVAFALISAGIAYELMPHVQARLDGFFARSGNHYQVERGLEAFANGGLFGKGPGEGTIKMVIPDAHADFVFAVAGEEFGLIACLVLIGLYVVILARSGARLRKSKDLFVVLAGGGLLVELSLQALVNMASVLHLIPTKGMTLPFVSYGGSSLLAMAMAMGMMLSLTRRNFGERRWA
ncbi:MAG: FtsW/RodA/SpoVE family cell cycle protein [Candidatus Symbiobacter sp.]|nr:FtsW/RodA/SpoVE family cell cycle protein [Candidatus Symbiobacter sp.]